jgi:general stress protein 26
LSRKRFLETLDHFSTAMLVTRSASGQLRSRPMAIAGTADSGRVWFMTRADSGKTSELSADPQVNVAMQNGQRFLSLSGTAHVVRDPRQAERLWDESQRAWFPDGPADATLVLIVVEPRIAEYWDRAGLDGVRFTLAEIGARLSGEALDGDGAGVHEKVELD